MGTDRLRDEERLRCLVTGASGYIGGRVVPELPEAGHRFRCLARSPDTLDALRGHAWAHHAESVRGAVPGGLLGHAHRWSASPCHAVASSGMAVPELHDVADRCGHEPWRPPEDRRAGLAHPEALTDLADGPARSQHARGRG